MFIRTSLHTNMQTCEELYWIFTNMHLYTQIFINIQIYAQINKNIHNYAWICTNMHLFTPYRWASQFNSFQELLVNQIILYPEEFSDNRSWQIETIREIEQHSLQGFLDTCHQYKWCVLLLHGRQLKKVAVRREIEFSSDVSKICSSGRNE